MPDIMSCGHSVTGAQSLQCCVMWVKESQGLNEGDGLMIKAQDRTELIGQGGLFHSLTYRQSISPGSIVGNSLFKIKICYISWSPFHEKSYVIRQENRFDKSNLGMSTSTKCF